MPVDPAGTRNRPAPRSQDDTQAGHFTATDPQSPATRYAARLAARGRHAVDLGDRGPALPDLLQAVVAQAAHALAHGDFGDPIRRRALDGERPDLLGDGHDLVEPDAPAIARAAAARAADGFVG